MGYTADPRMDDYIDNLPGWQQPMIKRTVQPYLVLDGNICALLATKDHANGFLYDGEGTGADVRPDHREQPRGRLAQLKK